MIITLIKIIITIDCNRVSWKSKVPPLSERQFTGNTMCFCFEIPIKQGAIFIQSKALKISLLQESLLQVKIIGVKHCFHKIIIAKVALITQVTSEVGSCD